MSIEELRRSAEAGDAQAQFELGRCYEYGINLVKDISRARQLYRKSAEQGNIDAQYSLGCLCNGMESIQWYRKPAEQGHECAKEELIKRGFRTFPEWSHGKQNKREDSTGKNSYFEFPCALCKSKLRLAYPFNSDGFRCPSGKTIYEVKAVSDAPKVYVVIPQEFGKAEKHSGERKRKPEVPPKVKDALAVFDLPPEAGSDESKTTFRKRMNEYHPDKVAHLGKELKKLAEDKTKHFIATFEIIKTYYETEKC